MVARLLWEQDAAGSSPVTSTIKKERTFLCVLFYYCKSLTFACSILIPKQGTCFGQYIRALPVADEARIYWRSGQNSPLPMQYANFGYRKSAASPKKLQVRVLSLRPNKRHMLLHMSFVFLICKDSKAGSWRGAGGTSQPAWLFRRKASPVATNFL